MSPAFRNIPIASKTPIAPSMRRQPAHESGRSTAARTHRPRGQDTPTDKDVRIRPIERRNNDDDQWIERSMKPPERPVAGHTRHRNRADPNAGRISPNGRVLGGTMDPTGAPARTSGPWHCWLSTGPPRASPPVKATGTEMVLVAAPARKLMRNRLSDRAIRSRRCPVADAKGADTSSASSFTEQQSRDHDVFKPIRRGRGQTPQPSSPDRSDTRHPADRSTADLRVRFGDPRVHSPP
jgi:hypothetical protein